MPAYSGRALVLSGEVVAKMFEGLFQPVHLLIIFGIVLMIVGPAKLGNLGGALGKSVRDFKQATKDEMAAEGEAEKS